MEHLIIIALEFESAKVERAVNMRYFKQAYFNDNTLILEFEDFKLYHQCKKVFSLQWLLTNLLNKEDVCPRIVLKTLEN